MSDRTLHVRYRRVEGAELFDVELESPDEEIRLVGVDYPSMIAEVSRELNRSTYAQLVFQRTDREGLFPMVADDKEKDLIRDNPIRYVAMTSPENRKVIVRTLRDATINDLADRFRTYNSNGPVLRAGYDTLADSFGDDVYVRRRDDDLVECPCCGRWHCRLTELDEFRIELSCPCEFRHHGGGSVTGSWVSIPTQDLIDHKVERFFLPRAWNYAGPWIARDLLRRMYERFVRERDHAVP